MSGERLTNRGARPALRRTEPPAASREPVGEVRVLSLPSLGGHPKIKDVIFQELRERIVFGSFAPGDRLVEAELASRFGVSKTPVREALLTLEGEGLVVLRPHRGAEVTRLSVEEWNDLIFLRDSIEVGALDAIFRSMTEAHFAQAEAALSHMADAWAEHDYRRYRRAQRQLHHTILGSPGYPSLPEAAVQLNDRLDRYGRLLVTRDLARWGADLEMNQRRIELIRQKDAKTYARMIQSRHAGGSAIIAKLTEEMEAEGDAFWGTSRGRRGEP
jgi:DNA-binding GntR family transcriptional regulator